MILAMALEKIRRQGWWTVMVAVVFEKIKCIYPCNAVIELFYPFQAIDRHKRLRIQSILHNISWVQCNIHLILFYDKYYSRLPGN